MQRALEELEAVRVDKEERAGAHERQEDHIHRRAAEIKVDKLVSKQRKDVGVGGCGVQGVEEERHDKVEDREDARQRGAKDKRRTGGHEPAVGAATCAVAPHAAARAAVGLVIVVWIANITREREKKKKTRKKKTRRRKKRRDGGHVVLGCCSYIIFAVEIQ